MNGLELAESYFETYGRPMLEKEFPHLLPYLAAGLCGSGSECFGFDDEISRNTDFSPTIRIKYIIKLLRYGRLVSAGNTYIGNAEFQLQQAVLYLFPFFRKSLVEYFRSVSAVEKLKLP